MLHNIAIDNNEQVPPPPENLNAEELDYLIVQGNINNAINNRDPGRINERNIFDLRQHFINNHFRHL